MTSYETILVDVDGDGVATLTLEPARPMNAFDHTMDREFHEAMWALDADDAVRAIVVTGAGRAFCAGIDLARARRCSAPTPTRRTTPRSGSTPTPCRSGSAFWSMRTPVIGAINGAAVGAGLTVPMLFDLRIVADDAKLGFVFTRRGIVPDANITWLLPRLVGVERALDLLLTGRMFTGAEAAAMGLALRAVPRADVLAAAQELAGELARPRRRCRSGSPSSWCTSRSGRPTARRPSPGRRRSSGGSGEQADAVEGVMSFMERRDPNWTVSKHTELPTELVVSAGSARSPTASSPGRRTSRGCSAAGAGHAAS